MRAHSSQAPTCRRAGSCRRHCCAGILQLLWRQGEHPGHWQLLLVVVGWAVLALRCCARVQYACSACAAASSAAASMLGSRQAWSFPAGMETNKPHHVLPHPVQQCALRPGSCLEKRPQEVAAAVSWCCVLGALNLPQEAPQAERLDVQQLRLSFFEDQSIVLWPALTPEKPAGPLPWSAVLVARRGWRLQPGCGPS